MLTYIGSFIYTIIIASMLHYTGSDEVSLYQFICLQMLTELLNLTVLLPNVHDVPNHRFTNTQGIT